MAQQYNQFGQNTNQIPNTTYGQIPGLFPTSLPFQPSFQPAWPNTPSWQVNGQYDFGEGNFLPGDIAPSNGYFPGQQADYISLDNGEEFYGDQDHTMSEAQGPLANQPSQSNSDNSVPLQPSAQSPNAAPKPPTSTDSSQMLNTLRAKLMRQKAAAEKAKTPEATVKVATGNGNGTIDKQVESGSDVTALKASEAHGKTIVHPEFKDHVNGISSDQENSAQRSSTPSNVNETASKASMAEKTSQSSVSNLDIEALFSSVRATEAAKLDQQAEIKAPPLKVAEVKSGKEKVAKDKGTSKKVVKPNIMNKNQPLQTKKDTHQDAQDSTSQSEQLEQGEIREEPSKSTSPSTKPSTPKVPNEKVLSEKAPDNKVLPEKASNGALAAPLKANQPANLRGGVKPLEKLAPKHDTMLVNDPKGKPPSPTATKPFVTKPKESRDHPSPLVSRNDRREERDEQYDRRGDYRDDRRDDRRSDHRESYAGTPRYPYDRPKAYDREYDRDRSAQWDSFRPPTRSRADEATAASRSRGDETMAAEASDHRKSLVAQSPKNDPKPEPKAGPKESMEPDSRAGRVLEIRTAFPGPRSPEVEKGPTTAKDDDLEDAADIQDWLEMTGYFDKAYRDKALARHRKLMELDRQRAELEMETKVELEERLHLARFSSLMPRASIEGRSFTPQIFARPSMPPPPVPAKEVRNHVDIDSVQQPKEDVGIKIKDLARRNSITTTSRVEEAPREPRPAPGSSALTPGLKRPHSGDLTTVTSKPVEKLARTDSRSYSFDKKSQPSPTSAKPPASASLESRISVDNGTHTRREYQARSRSPDLPRRRSPSPLPHYRNAAVPLGDSRIPRRLSDDDGYSPLRRPNLSRDASPHMRGGPPYDGLYDNGGSHARYERYRADYDTRSNPSYDSYTNERRGGYVPYRGRGRGRGRAGHAQYRGSYSKTFDRRGSE